MIPARRLKLGVELARRSPQCPMQTMLIGTLSRKNADVTVSADELKALNRTNWLVPELTTVAVHVGVDAKAVENVAVHDDTDPVPAVMVKEPRPDVTVGEDPHELMVGAVPLSKKPSAAVSLPADTALPVDAVIVYLFVLIAKSLVTPRVPATSVFPVEAATVNLFVFT